MERTSESNEDQVRGEPGTGSDAQPDEKKDDVQEQSEESFPASDPPSY